MDLNEIDDNNFVECVESSNGIATVTLNSGNQPGSVPLRVELYDIQTLEDLPIYKASLKEEFLNRSRKWKTKLDDFSFKARSNSFWL